MPLPRPVRRPAAPRRQFKKALPAKFARPLPPPSRSGRPGLSKKATPPTNLPSEEGAGENSVRQAPPGGGDPTGWAASRRTRAPLGDHPILRAGPPHFGDQDPKVPATAVTQPLPRGPDCPAAAGLPKPADLGETASPEGIGSPPAGTFPRKRLGRRTDRSPVRPATASRTPPFPEGDADINDAARPVDGLPRTLGDALPKKPADRRPHPPARPRRRGSQPTPEGAMRDPRPDAEWRACRPRRKLCPPCRGLNLRPGSRSLSKLGAPKGFRVPIEAVTPTLPRAIQVLNGSNTESN